MLIFRRVVAVFFLTVGFCFIITPRVYAYIDPGTGSYIFQAIIAALLAAGFAIKVYWRRIKLFFSARGKNVESK